MQRRVVVSVPGSSANLGPGYDCLAVAVQLRCEVEVEQRPGPLEVVVEGEGAGEIARDSGNLVVAAFGRLWPGGLGDLRFSLRNRLPLAAGLGSSSAAIVAGLAVAQALQSLPMDAATLLAPAAALEGHADNVAAAILGGLVVAVDGPAPVARRIEPPPDLRFVLALPSHRLATSTSRAALRPHVPHEDAVHTLARAALLVAALADGDLTDVPAALDDRLHEPDRGPLVPLLGHLRSHVQKLGAMGVTLSGAGPGVLVWTTAEDVDQVQARVADVAGSEVDVRVLVPDPLGVQVVHTE